MKTYFEINTSSDFSADPVWLILQHGAGLSGYILYAPESKQVVKSILWQLENGDSDISDVLSEIQFITKVYNHILCVSLVNYSPSYSAFPQMVFEQEKLRVWWDLLIGENTEEKLLINEVASSDTIHVHSLSTTYHDGIHELLNDLKIYSFQQFSHVIQDDHKNTLRFAVFNKHIFVALSKEGMLLLNQSYSFESPEDILYILLNMVTQFELDRKSVELIPEGFIDPDSVLYKLLEQYFEQLQMNKEYRSQFPDNANELSPHILSHIDRIITCVS